MSSLPRKKGKKKFAPDMYIIYFTILMMIFGAIMIFDASVYTANATQGDSLYYLKQQLIWIGVGSFLAIILYFWDYRKLMKLSPLFFGLATILLVLVLIFGKDINGSKRWFEFGFFPRIQPAEFAKPAFILYLASWISGNPYFKSDSKNVSKQAFFKTLLSFLAIVGIMVILIALEPDYGTAAILTFIALAMFFSAKEGKDHRKYSIITLIVTIVLGFGAMMMKSYRRKRLATYLHLLRTGEIADVRETGYQLHQILIGIGSAGFFGKGFGQSRQRFGYLVENTAFTDSIFAVILEELGFLGGLILVGVWIFFLWRGFKVAKNAPDKAGKILAIGITVWLTFQTFLNMSANVGLIPITGIPIPLLSYGGSSTIATMIGLGMLINISKYSKKHA